MLCYLRIGYDLALWCTVKVSIKPFILRSQLYSSVMDRTQVDRELEVRRRTQYVIWTVIGLG